MIVKILKYKEKYLDLIVIFKLMKVLNDLFFIDMLI